MPRQLVGQHTTQSWLHFYLTILRVYVFGVVLIYQRYEIHIHVIFAFTLYLNSNEMCLINIFI